MSKKLTRIAEASSGLFDHLSSPLYANPTRQLGAMPVCGECGNRGFVNCPQAILPEGDLIVVAFNEGCACSCPAGAEFSKNQMEWLDQTKKENS